jgi:type I restriction enzyme S subunit
MTSSSDFPDTWAYSTIGDHVRFEGGTQPPRSTFVFEEREGYIRLVQTRDFKTDKYTTFIPATANHKTFTEKDIMIGRYGPPVFQIYRGLKGAYNVALIKASPKTKAIDSDYLFYTLKQDKLFTLIDSLSRRSSGQTGIDMDALKSFPLLLPPLNAQRTIVSILRTWDNAIDKAIQIHGIKEKIYSWLTEKVLVAPTLKGITEAQKAAKPLSEFTSEIVTRNSANALGRERVMGVSNTKGIVPMREQTIAGDLSRYKVLPQRAFAYNPMRINVGSIAMSRLDSEVLVSPDYVLFACKDGSLDPDYFDHLCNTHWWSHHITESGTGSVRQRIYYDDLAALRIVIPPFKQQKKIANCLNQAKHEIELIEAQIAMLEKQKRGLMQKLLTGEWRVKC